MTLTLSEPGRLSFQGDLTFDNAPVVEQQGRDQLEKALESAIDQIDVSLHALGQADSSALSVCLSWIRFVRSHDIRLCFTDVPKELHALATLCGISHILTSTSTPL